ncbi:MAG: DUF1552 domain-containing protein, partial [Acidobacteria bacterium]|nr:DUF1552 domain-containing protein [Acidobacteriota bacterium]
PRRCIFGPAVPSVPSHLPRVINFMMSPSVPPPTHPDLGIPDPHHGLSHHQNRPEQMTKLAKVNRHHIDQLAYFMTQLDATPDGDGSLLDHVVMQYGCGISDGNQHLHVNLPVLVAGGGAGRIRGGRHLRVAEETPLTNLQVALLEKLDVPVETLGDSTGAVKHLSGV